jgi:hypothetical protein
LVAFAFRYHRHRKILYRADALKYIQGIIKLNTGDSDGVLIKILGFSINGILLKE